MIWLYTTLKFVKDFRFRPNSATKHQQLAYNANNSINNDILYKKQNKLRLKYYFYINISEKYFNGFFGIKYPPTQEVRGAYTRCNP